MIAQREWRRANYELVRNRLEPPIEDSLFLFAFGARLGDPPINPVIDLIEVLTVGWNNGAIEREDLLEFWDFAKLRFPLPELNFKDTRPLIQQFNEIRIHPDEIATPAATSTHYPLFVDMHWQFRQDLPAVLYAMTFQSAIYTALWDDVSLLYEDDQTKLQKELPLVVDRAQKLYDEDSFRGHAFRGLFQLYFHMTRLRDAFHESPLWTDVNTLYAPWMRFLRTTPAEGALASITQALQVRS